MVSSVVQFFETLLQEQTENSQTRHTLEHCAQVLDIFHKLGRNLDHLPRQYKSRH